MTDLDAKRLEKYGDTVEIRVQCLPGSARMNIEVDGPDWLTNTDMLIILKTLEEGLSES